MNTNSTTHIIRTQLSSRRRRRGHSRAAAVAAAMSVTAILGAAQPVAGRSATPISGTSAAGFDQVDLLIQDYLDDNDLAGATVAVTKGGRLVFSKGYGYADIAAGIEMQPDHRSRIGSTSKVITAIAAMQLVENGQIDLDQQLYGTMSPVWGPEWGTAPSVIVNSDGALDNPSDYAAAMVDGVAALGTHFPPADHLDDIPSANWALLLQAAYEQEVTTVLERGSAVRVSNVLSHTAGYRNSASAAKQGAEDHFGVSLDDVTAAQFHQAVLLGTAGAPFVFDPATAESYSNFGFSAAGLLIEEASGASSYRDYVDQHLLEPLGLFDVVPNNAEWGPLDAQPYNSDGSAAEVDLSKTSRLGLSTGGWSASAQDLARILCSTDQAANNLRSLDPDSVTVMAADAAPAVPGTNPIGWDSSDGIRMSKNGSLPGGSSRISKYLPGALDATSHEINVAVVFNQNGATPTSSLLNSIAEIAAEASVAPTYDLFKLGSRCRVGLPVRGTEQVTQPEVPVGTKRERASGGLDG